MNSWPAEFGSFVHTLASASLEVKALRGHRRFVFSSVTFALQFLCSRKTLPATVNSPRPPWFGEKRRISSQPSSGTGSMSAVDATSFASLFSESHQDALFLLTSHWRRTPLEQIFLSLCGVVPQSQRAQRFFRTSRERLQSSGSVHGAFAGRIGRNIARQTSTSPSWAANLNWEISQAWPGNTREN